MSSEFSILYSLPSSLISVPPYLLIKTRSPFLTSNGTFLPLSSVLPVPSATTSPSVGFSLAVSGIMIPPFLVSFSSTGSTRTRSPSGFRLTAIRSFSFCWFDFYLRIKSRSTHCGKIHSLRARSKIKKALTLAPHIACPIPLILLFIDHLGVNDGSFVFLCFGLWLAGFGLRLAFAGASLFRRRLVKLG